MPGITGSIGVLWLLQLIYTSLLLHLQLKCFLFGIGVMITNRTVVSANEAESSLPNQPFYPCSRVDRKCSVKIYDCWCFYQLFGNGVVMLCSAESFNMAILTPYLVDQPLIEDRVNENPWVVRVDHRHV